MAELTVTLPPTAVAGWRGGRKARQEWIARHVTLLRATDAAVVAGAVIAGYLPSEVRLVPGTGNYGAGVLTAAAVGLLWLLALELHRTRDPRILGVGAQEYKRVASASLRVFGLMAAAAVVLSVPDATTYVTVSLPLGLVALTGNRWMFRRRLGRAKSRGHCLARAVVAGELEEVRYVVQQVSRKSGPVYEILGVCLPGGRRGANLLVDGHRFPVLSSTEDIPRTARLQEADAVIVAGPLPGGNRSIRELGWNLEESAVDMVLATALTNVAGPRIHWQPVEGLPLMHVDVPRYSGAKHALKRGMDIVLALAALLALLPLLLLLAVIVRLDSPGPVLFRQTRVGKDGRKFAMFKFRSMIVDAEDRLRALHGHNDGAGVLFKLREDPRVTRCGRWMRKYSLDELPQLWNVVLGHMSLVGPRPPLDREVSGYERHTHRRLLIKPGITGLWQVSGRSDLAWDEAVRLDLYYVENWSIAGDLLILWRTVRAVIRPSGAY